MNFIKNKFNSTILLILIGMILILVRIYLILELPIFAYIDYINDDELMVEQAMHIKAGNWLGKYSYNTFLKAPIFSMYLAVLSIFKIPYIFATTCVYVFSSILFVYSIKNIIKNKYALFVIFLLMLFNPIMYSTDFQRVYRNSLTPSLAIILISFLNIALLNRNEEKLTKYFLGFLGASIVFPFFYYIREDSIWIMPLVFFYMGIIGINEILEFIKDKKINVKRSLKVIFIFSPLIFLTIFEAILGGINYKYYGDRAINMENFTSLKEVIYAINIVKNDDLDSGVTNSRQKMRKIYEHSPTLNSMKDNCEYLQDVLSGKENGDVGDGMFLWAFLETLSYSGYYTLEDQKMIFENITKEINDAISSGKLETQELTPIFGDAAKFKLNYSNLLKGIVESFKLINDYKTFSIMDTYGSLYSSDQFETRIRYFLEITNDKLLLNNEPNSWKSFGELIKDNQVDYLNKMQPKLDVLNSIRNIYYVISKVITVIGYLSYIIITIILVRSIIHKNYKEILNQWFVLSGTIGSVFTLCFGIAYTSTVKVYVTIAFYLMSGYILNTIFCLMSIFVLLNIVIKKYESRRLIDGGRDVK